MPSYDDFDDYDFDDFDEYENPDDYSYEDIEQLADILVDLSESQIEALIESVESGDTNWDYWDMMLSFDDYDLDADESAFWDAFRELYA